MLTREDRKLIKYLKELYESGRNQIAEYNSFYYMSDIKKDDEGQINWFFNNDFEAIKKYCLEVGFKEVYKSLERRGYNPTSQIIGYLIFHNKNE